MTMRTTSRTVTFDNSFCLAGFGEELPAGDYIVETDEELLEGLSFAAYRRVQTMLHLPPSDRSPGRQRVLTIRPEALDAALERDRSLVSGDALPGGTPVSSKGGQKEATPDAAAEARAENEGMVIHLK